MIYRVYCGLVDFYIAVEAASEEEAIKIGRERLIERIKEAEFYVETTHSAEGNR